VAAAQQVLQQASEELYKLLVDSERAYRDAARLAEKHRRLRNDVVRAAAQGGVSRSEIANIIGLSRARVAQILEGEEGT